MAIDALHNIQLLTDTITVTRNYIPVAQLAPLEESINYRGREGNIPGERIRRERYRGEGRPVAEG
jgi:hypothetical protein